MELTDSFFEDSVRESGYQGSVTDHDELAAFLSRDGTSLDRFPDAAEYGEELEEDDILVMSDTDPISVEDLGTDDPRYVKAVARTLSAVTSRGFSFRTDGDDTVWMIHNETGSRCPATVTDEGVDMWSDDHKGNDFTLTDYGDDVTDYAAAVERRFWTISSR